jgi:hypothetical protein
MAELDDKIVAALRKEMKAEKAERAELLEELRRSRRGDDEDEKVSPRERMRRGHEKIDREREGGDDGDHDE